MRNTLFFSKLEQLENQFSNTCENAFYSINQDKNSFYLVASFSDNTEIIELQDKNFETATKLIAPQKIGTAITSISSSIEDITRIINKYIDIAKKQKIKNSSLNIDLTVINPCFDELSKTNIYLDFFQKYELEEYKKEVNLFKKQKEHVITSNEHLSQLVNTENFNDEITKEIFNTNQIVYNFYNSYTLVNFAIDYLTSFLASIQELINLIEIYFSKTNEENDLYKNKQNEQRFFLFQLLENPKNSFVFSNIKIEPKIKSNNEYINVWNFRNSIEKNNKEMSNSIKNHEIKLFYSYSINTIQDFLNITFIEIIKNKLVINKCINCNKLFVPSSRTDEKYCNRISPQNSKKTCKEYGVKKTYREEIKSHPIKSIHYNISQAYRMRIKRAKNNTEKAKYEKEFKTYQKNFEIKRMQYKNKKLSEEKFIEWLKTQ